ncbi:XLF-domain-containing protein [Stemphylium lycopersici]|uniref:Non-homologous end-joining factor 1 n=1 Tax=Stemphylium lycopersici TaxID=183478 RepID=A0A364MU42_STELY|nr:XLF-domain-containing protein [Stemphylium lycopersici]RAR02854.1 XLF-domain-containing protein [Stemphylium lycopersici]
MSCWRALDLFEQPDNGQMPQLLIKPSFYSDSYTVHLTDLSNIWCEELGLHDIVDRASQEQAPIEVSKQDTAQLAILLDNVMKPLQNVEGSTCRITRSEDDGIVLHTSMILPEPLDCLTWKFHLQKRTSTTLKDELILPLLISSHLQDRRITSLINTITVKDKAITRLVDHFDSANMDLATAFPSVGGIKAGRRGIKREQAAKHIPALQLFREETWRQDTAQLGDSDLTTLGLFQEALAQTRPKVPEQLKSGISEGVWWNAAPTKLAPLKMSAKSKAKKPASPPKAKESPELNEEETEDEFDTHDNFKTRNLPPKSTKVPDTSRLKQPLQGNDDDENDSTEDEDDLDAPTRRHSQDQVRKGQQPEHRKSSSSEQRSSPPVAAPAAAKVKPGNFRIGGKTRKPTHSPSPVPENTHAGEDANTVLAKRGSVPPSSQEAESTMTPKKSRAPFRIGGRGRAGDGGASQRATTASPSKNHSRATHSPTTEPPSPPPQPAKREMTPVQELQEETPEEKAEPSDHHSRNDADANANASSQHLHGASSFRPSASNANNSSSSQTYSQQQSQSQHFKKMTTLTPSPAGRSQTLDTAVQGRVEQANSQASLIPRSALVGASRTRRANTLSDARFLLDSQGYSNVSISIPSDKESWLDLKVTHDGKVTELVARFESLIGSSDAFQVSPNHPSAPSSNSVHSPDSPEERNHPSPMQASSQLGQSPRKPIPAHWLPKGTVPNLATAQRAKERTHKKDTAAVSSSDTKTLRLTRSSADLGRSNSKEGATYLTKEALAAVEHAVVPLASPQTHAKISSPSSKPAWNSPITPPARGSARQHPMHTIKMSPTKSSYLAAESMPTGHSRTTSSIATSTGKTSFYSADGSPVRSPASTVHSFQSAAESLEDQDFPTFDLSADTKSEQLPRHLNTSPTSAIKSISGTRVGVSKPRLSFRTPNLRYDPGIGNTPLAPPPTDTVASSNNSSAGLVLAADTSRIPRVSTSARNTDTARTSALQRAESVRALESKIKLLQDAHIQPDETAIPQIFTSDSSHARVALETEHIPTNPQTQNIDHLPPKGGKLFSRLESTADEKLESCGMTNLTSSRMNPFVLMMAHIPNTVDNSRRAVIDDDGTNTIDAAKAGENSAPARGRSECATSDLRPTAIEFVPRTSPAILPTSPVDEPEDLAPLQDLAGLPDMMALDRNGIPFLWYMYGVQFAYEQGFRNGRPKSPRKHKSKVARGSQLSSGDPPRTSTTQPTGTASVTAIHPSFKTKQRSSSAEPMPPPQIPAHQIQAKYYYENEQSSFQKQRPSHDVDDTVSSSPFASQINLIDQQAALSNRTNTNTPRHYNIDLTRISNVGLPTGPRYMQAPIHYTMPRNHHRASRHPGNGLYGGRGNAAGVPLDATTPFPNAIPPQGRQGYGLAATGSAADYQGYTIGKDACGIVEITNATESIGGGLCNACDSHH